MTDEHDNGASLRDRAGGLRPEPLRARIAELEEAIGDALKCTPFIAANEIRYDCGDPWKLLRATLNGEKKHG